MDRLSIPSWPGSIPNHFKFPSTTFIDQCPTGFLSKILLKRKAICVGYCQLFFKLCDAANVRSVIVDGYTKGKLFDLGNHFYLPDHCWNAAYINNEWKLFDACWDAGYVYPLKRRFLNKIYTWVIPHYPKLYKVKPHFVFNPVHTYFNRSGDYFKYDHLSANPIWQLRDPITIEAS